MIVGAIVLSASGAGAVVVVWVVLGLAFTAVNVTTVLRSRGHDDDPTGVAWSSPRETTQPASGPAIRYRVPRVFVWLLIGCVVIVTAVGTVGLVVATVVGSSPPPIVFTAAFISVSTVIWYGLLGFFAMEIVVWPSDGRVVFRCLAKERATSLGDITAISMGAGKSDAVIVRYRGGTARVLMYLDWNDFISRVRERNPEVEVKGF